MKQPKDVIPRHWLIGAAGGIGAYVTFLGALKVALPDLSRNELLGLYTAITGLLIVICLIAVWVTRKARVPSRARKELTRILIVWIISGLAGIVLFLMLMSPPPLICAWERLKSIVQHPSFALTVQYEDNTLQLVGKGQTVVIKPNERITLNVELPFLCKDLRNDFSFFATSRFGDVRSSSTGKFEYMPREDDSVDYIIVYVTNRRTGQRSEQSFNVVIQEH